MKTIKDMSFGKVEILGSTFISFLYPSNSKDEVNDILSKLRKEYPKARHICYACNVKDYVHSSDDGEPSSTAGKPLLQILTMNNLINASLFVVRYFGGTKLGAGRLLRTYVEAGTLAVNKSTRYDIVNGYIYKCETGYETYNHILSYSNKNKYDILNINFEETIKFDIVTSIDIEKNLKELFPNLKYEKLNKEILLKENENE